MRGIRGGQGREEEGHGRGDWEDEFGNKYEGEVGENLSQNGLGCTEAKFGFE